MCDCDEPMDAKTKYYLTKIQGQLGRCQGIPEPCAKRLIAQLEAKSVKAKPKPKKPKQDGSKGADMAPKSGD